MPNEYNILTTYPAVNLAFKKVKNSGLFMKITEQFQQWK